MSITKNVLHILGGSVLLGSSAYLVNLENEFEDKVKNIVTSNLRPIEKMDAETDAEIVKNDKVKYFQWALYALGVIIIIAHLVIISNKQAQRRTQGVGGIGINIFHLLIGISFCVMAYYSNKVSFIILGGIAGLMVLIHTGLLISKL